MHYFPHLVSKCQINYEYYAPSFFAPQIYLYHCPLSFVAPQIYRYHWPLSFVPTSPQMRAGRGDLEGCLLGDR